MPDDIVARLRAEAAQLRAQIEEHRAAIARLNGRVRSLETAAASEERARQRRLSGGGKLATVANMTRGQVDYARRKAAVGRDTLHPLQAWLYQRPWREDDPGPRSSGELANWLTQAGIATSDKAVRTWWAKKPENRRATPGRAADAISKAWGFPATAANYPNGIWRRKSE